MPAENQNESPLRIFAEAVKGWVKLLLLLIGFLCFLAGGWWLYCLKENHLGRKEWARVKAELEAKGETLDWESFIAEPIPDELNFAKAPIIDSIAMKAEVPVKTADWIAYEAMGIYPHLGIPESQEQPDFAAMVRDIEQGSKEPVNWTAASPAAQIRERLAFEPKIEQQLILAAKRPQTHFSFGPTERSEFSTPNYVNFRTLAQRADIIASADLASGKPRRAMDILRVNLALSRGLHGEESVLVGAMIGVAVENLNFGTVWRGLVDHAWEEEQLLELDRELRRRDLIASIQDAMRRERALSGAWFSDTQSVHTFHNFSQLIGGSSRSLDSRFLSSSILPDGWAYRARVAYATWIQDTVLAFYDRHARVATPSVVSQADGEIKRLKLSKHPRDRIILMSTPNFTKAYVVASHHQVQIDHARTAIAIERFRMQMNRLPEDLSDLVPSYLDELPRDRIGGVPYRYRPLTEEEYMLWSVGWNEVDEDGAVAVKMEEGDWVWFSFAKDEALSDK